MSQPSPVWARLGNSITDLRDRTRWQDNVRTTDGRSYICRFQPLAGGSALIAFRPHLTDAPRLSPVEPGLRPRAVAGS
jgi:hypothetical protein